MKISRYFSFVFSAIIISSGSLAFSDEASKINEIFDYEMIGANVAYFEKIAGPAKKTILGTNTYRISGCNVDARISGGTISSIRLELNDKCTFNMHNILPNVFDDKFSAHNLTFGKFDEATNGLGRFYADCLSMCGNAFDPSVYEYWSGSSADLDLEVVLQVEQVSDPVLAAASKWQQAMESVEGHDWIVDGSFNCDRNYDLDYDEIASEAFRDIKVSAIEIGYGLEKSRCDQ